MKLTTEALRQIMPNVDPNWAPEYARAITSTANDFGINTPLRMAAWLGNIAHESAELSAWREWGGASMWYSPYFGRGPIQLTHYANYNDAGTYLELDLLRDPDLVARDTQVGFDTAGWFFRYGNGDQNPLADEGNFWECYLRVLGGDNGSFPERKVYYDRALEVLREEEEEQEEQPTVWPQQAVEVSSDGWAFVRHSEASGAQERLWLRAKPGLLYSADNEGWLKQEGFEPPAPEKWAWPVADKKPGWIGDGSYVDLYPTRYNWLPERPDVEAIARRMVDKYPGKVWANTYHRHPPDVYPPSREKDSVDFWGYAGAGRGTPIDPSIGQAIFDELFADPSKPDFDWAIWNGWLWSYRGGWEWWGDHYDHVHISYLED